MAVTLYIIKSVCVNQKITSAILIISKPHYIGELESYLECYDWFAMFGLYNIRLVFSDEQRQFPKYNCWAGYYRNVQTQW